MELKHPQNGQFFKGRFIQGQIPLVIQGQNPLDFGLHRFQMHSLGEGHLPATHKWERLSALTNDDPVFD